MYPRITLLIENHIPKVQYQPEEEMTRDLITEEENLKDLVLDLANKLELTKSTATHDDEQFAELLRLSTEGNERFVEDIPELNSSSLAFDLSDIANYIIIQADTLRTDHSIYAAEASAEVINELKRNENIDIFATTLEALFNALIARTLLFAAELGITAISLRDESGILRLQERMASELSKIGIELIIE